jgi:hypothetical protein
MNEGFAKENGEVIFRRSLSRKKATYRLNILQITRNQGQKLAVCSSFF